MKAVLTVVTIFALCCSACASSNRGGEESVFELRRQVQVSTDTQGVPCKSGGVIRAGNLAQREEVAVHSSPDRGAQVVDSLASGDFVVHCEYVYEGIWSSVIYDTRSEKAENFADTVIACGLLIGAGMSEFYSGPCAAGWIESRFLDIGTDKGS